MAPPPPPPRSRRESPIFRAVDAARRVWAAEGDLINATRDTIEAHAAGACLTCGAEVKEQGAKLCTDCTADVAEAGAELGVRAVAPALKGFLEGLLGGPRLPRSR